MNVAPVRAGAPETAKAPLPLVTEVAPPLNVEMPVRTDPSAAATPSAPAQSASAPPVKPAYPPPAEVPTQEGPKGLRFDFNCGARVLLPESENPWKIRLRGLDTGNILFETQLQSGHIHSTKRYYVRFHLEAMR